MTFTDGGNPMCAVVPLGAGGTATCSTNALGAGTHTIIASYGGDAGNMVSSGMVAQVINAGGGGGAGTTMTTLVSSANPAASGASVMFTATVTGAAPTGSVNFKDGAGSIANCAVVNLAAGSGNSRTATCTTNTLSVATHSITAKYSGDANNATSTSATISGRSQRPGGGSAEGRVLAANTLIAPQSVTITATATETGGTIARVSLYVDGAKVADLTTSPYTFTTAALGRHAPDLRDRHRRLGTVTSTLTQNVVAISAPPPVASTDANIWRLLTRPRSARRRPKRRRSRPGNPGWIDNQFLQPVSGYPDSKYNVLSLKTIPSVCATQDPQNKNYPADSPQAICARDHLTLAGIQRDFFTNAITAPDQLRQRVAWALSQIAVTSGNERDLSYAYVMSRYQNIMFQEAFGNYQTLLQKITLSPAMGNYLDMVNNDRASAPRGERELRGNHAALLRRTRRIERRRGDQDAQAFRFRRTTRTPSRNSPGVHRLHVRRSANPRAATKKNGASTRRTWSLSDYRERRPRTRPRPLNVSGADQPDAAADLDAAVQNVFLHPNTPAYISRQLISAWSRATRRLPISPNLPCSEQRAGRARRLKAVVRRSCWIRSANVVNPAARSAACVNR